VKRDAEGSVPPEAYTRDYYESHCAGYTEFRDSKGESLPARLRVPFELAEIARGMSVLDVGCGRGEILLQASQYGAKAIGFDYAVSALKIAADAIATRPDAETILIHLGNAQWLPYQDNSFDRVFMLDVVEHLYPEELLQALVEARRVLRPGGRLIIHTMPNTWYYRFGYPLFRLGQRLRGKHFPADPRDRWGYKHVHVNEQNLILLRCELRTAGFRAKVWLAPIQSYAEEPSRWVRFVMRALAMIYPFRYVFCNDLLAVAVE
jgi:cyclopropane fatty-acyl-phospholipid synthase-like methyltransferase